MDHAKEAERLLEDVEVYVNDWHSCRAQRRDTSLVDRIAYAMDAAQISAVSAMAKSQLALAEQQRIANLIALVGVSGSTGFDPLTFVYEQKTIGDDDNPFASHYYALLPDVARALGLDSDGGE